VDGIPRFTTTTEAGQKQTADSFGYKWKKRDTYDSPAALAALGAWEIERYGFPDAACMRSYFTSRRLILDAGCGAGFSASVWLADCCEPVRWIGADISEAIDVARQRLGHVPGTHFVQADLMQMPFRPGTFDTIFSEGVLHHTPSTERALKALAPLLASGGEFLFYVYRKKGPIREFADDYIRDLISGLPAEQAWEMLRPLTQLGQALAELKTEITVPADVPYLGIKAGKQDVQRLVYWSFLKLFWNEQLTFEENLHVNFDWYHPRHAHRQTEEEVRRWCAEAGLTIRHFNTQESGFTVRAIRN
jgi:SAM-dependent methyltransferase